MKHPQDPQALQEWLMVSLEVGYLRQGPDVTTHQLYSMTLLSTIPCSLLNRYPPEV